jgi:hypothetical protein
MMHHYEVSLWPTAAQALRLEHLAQAYQQLRWVAEQDWALAELTGTVIPDPEFTWAQDAGLPRALIESVSEEARVAAVEERVNLFGHRPPWPLALTGPGLVRPLGAGFVRVAGVPGSVAVGTGNPAQLPAWAREVLGREYRPGAPQVLSARVPSLRLARRVDWADLRLGHHGWEMELQLSWEQYAPFELSWVALQQEPDDPVLRLLME